MSQLSIEPNAATFRWSCIWPWRLALIALFLGAVPAQTLADGVAGVAIPHRALWPERIANAAAFDRASRAEILMFARALADSETLNADALKTRLGVDTVDTASVAHVQHELWKVLTENYAIAGAGCVPREEFCPSSDTSDLRHAAAMLSAADIQPRYKSWFDDASQFHRTYLDELLRSAALFPSATSEVETFNDNELTGEELHDRQFLLSFDDGPTRGLAGQGHDGQDTDLTIDMLRSHRVNGVFFSLGEPFQARLRDSSVEAMKTLYAGMCVGSHGWLHKSHAEWPLWKDSVASSSKLLHDILPDSYVPGFRPPYGQRLADSGPFFVSQGLKVVLWNIDSHDWDNALTADDVEQRVMSLMLLWRRGFILFHDLFPRARMAVPQLIALLAQDDIAWVDCHAIDWSVGEPLQ